MNIYRKSDSMLCLLCFSEGGYPGQMTKGPTHLPMLVCM